MTTTTPLTLHGLTLAQLEAIRGYSETVGGIAAMLPDAAALNADSSMFDIARAKRSLASIEACAKVGTPYGDGVRFALDSAPATHSLTTVREHVARAVLARRGAGGST